MVKIRIIVLLCLLGFLAAISPVDAQVTDCPLNYEKALMMFNRGMADSVCVILKPCLEDKQALKGLSKETCTKIFRLASLSSIMTGNPEEAERYARSLLKYQPDYKNVQHEGDLQEFRLILDRITPRPSLKAGITAGTNFPFVRLRKEYTNYQLDSPETSLSGSMGYLFRITGELALSKSIAVEAGVGINRIMFEYTISGRNQALNLVKNIYDQKITWVEIPVVAKNYLLKGSFKPYIEAGIAGRFSLYLREKSEMYGKYWLTESSNSVKILTTFMTDLENFNLVGGGGLCYDLKKINLRFDVRYIQNIRNSGILSNFDAVTGYEDIGTTEEFHYTDDLNLVSLQHMQISFGVMYNLNYRVF